MHFTFQGKEYTKRYHPDDIATSRIEGICACTGLLFFLPLVSQPNSRYGRYWANQGLLILFSELAALLLWLLLGWFFGLLAAIPVVGILFAVLRTLVALLLCLAVAILILLPMSFAIRGRAKDIPFIGFMRFIK